MRKASRGDEGTRQAGDDPLPCDYESYAQLISFAICRTLPQRGADFHPSIKAVGGKARRWREVRVFRSFCYRACWLTSGRRPSKWWKGKLHE